MVRWGLPMQLEIQDNRENSLSGAVCVPFAEGVHVAMNGHQLLATMATQNTGMNSMMLGYVTRDPLWVAANHAWQPVGATAQQCGCQ